VPVTKTPPAPAASPAGNDRTEEPAADEEDRTIFEETSAAEIAAQQRTIPAETDFEDLLVWIHALQNSVEALNAADNETDRARYRRRLGYLLVQRGILVEGEKALLSAVQGEGADSATAVADSVAVAEVRLEMGERESASQIARAIDTKRATPSERVRLAEVLLDTGQPVLASNLLDQTVGSVTGVLHSEATFLLARAHHATGRNAQARDAVRRLTSNAATPKAILPAALLLHADCEFALGRAREAEALYARAVAMDLPDEDASWAALQLGNLARRDGRDEEARRRWQSTTERYPDTFFASQAAWFLRVSETVRRVNEAEADDGRG
jgi:tetratricopeptide (TPR) repeat protein